MKNLLEFRTCQHLHVVYLVFYVLTTHCLLLTIQNWSHHSHWTTNKCIFNLTIDKWRHLNCLRWIFKLENLSFVAFIHSCIHSNFALRQTKSLRFMRSRALSSKCDYFLLYPKGNVRYGYCRTDFSLFIPDGARLLFCLSTLF